MPVEETMWDLPVSQDLERREQEALRAVLADMVAARLPPGKRLRRVVTWSADAGRLFRSRPHTRQYAVAYEVDLAV